MAESIQLTNLQLQDDILKNLLLGLQKQSQFYVLKINETGEINEERKNYEKELSDINKVLTELSSKALSYTVQELDNLRTQFNDKLTQLNSVISDLEINTLKIEFNSLTPEQKTFLKGEQGPRGEKGLNPYEFAVMFGFVGTESDYLLSLKGADGKSLTFDMLTPEQKASLKGADGQSLTFDMLTPEQKASLKGADGQSLTFDMLTPEQKAILKGADGQSLTFDMLTPEQKASLKGADGQSLTFDMLTPEQKASLKGADGQSLTFDMLTPEQKATLKGADGQSLTYDSLTLAQKEDLASHVTVSGGSSETSPTTIEDIEGLNDVIGDLYAKHGEQEQKFGGINLSQFYQQTQGRLGELDGKVIPLFNALFGVYEEDEATGQQILVQEGLIDRFNALNTQINPN